MKMNNFLGVTLFLVLLLIPIRAVPQERLLIIAPNEFIDELGPLKRFKEASGRPTLLMSLSQIYGPLVGGDAMQALAWSYAQTGQADRSTAIMAGLEREFASLDAQGTLLYMLNEVPYHYALNALLRGQQELALNRLETIYESGWRTYYEHHLDPRWDPLRDHPRIQSLMEKVKADVDRQRAELESTESHQAFVARLDAGSSPASENAE
jgi:hypothetical protein